MIWFQKCLNLYQLCNALWEYRVVITIDVLQFDQCVAIKSNVKLCGNSAQKGSVTAASYRTSLCPKVQKNVSCNVTFYGRDPARPVRVQSPYSSFVIHFPSPNAGLRLLFKKVIDQ